MNILFFLTPKSEVAYIYSDYTLRQVLEKMEHHRYSAIPIIDYEGEYIGTITEGDLLWAIKNEYDLSLRDSEEMSIMEIPRKMDNAPVYANCDMEDLVAKSMQQNFIPVIDDKNKFIGIITRKDIIEFCYAKYRQFV